MNNTLSEQTWAECQKAIKTDHLIKMLAETEVKNNHLFTTTELEKASRETNSNTITRRDIDIRKALINNLEYQTLGCELNSLLEQVKQGNRNYKDKVLNVVNQRDQIYKNICNSY
ncbi:MAG: hypothetical protein ACOCRK_07415 [bacterium]